MINRFPLLQNLTQWVKRSQSETGEAPEETNKAAIDIWSYAEPAGEEPDPLKRNVLQWRRLITSVREPLDIFPGQSVDITGFVHRQFPGVPNQFILARRIIRCCLADTVPLGLAIHIDTADDFENETWLKVKGVFGTVDVRNRSTLVVIPDQIQSIPEPKKAYINGVF
ncbi:TIGR03943 family putative permease subunit [Leptothoe spongobia]|uniref:TIGR03943 family protein n=1 Tax=Leptothoe spongobia TAU-MAC 1115 TaxID=1967444 RepID=A0A947GQ35_9CYAN|nr:TIGR03943 family protein [Leptothoe spongobia]MBT9316871.1 TIGR03943 family protein [Leptothoe spongobia TAU-MAC 1115]